MFVFEFFIFNIVLIIIIMMIIIIILVIVIIMVNIYLGFVRVRDSAKSFKGLMFYVYNKIMR